MQFRVAVLIMLSVVALASQAANPVYSISGQLSSGSSVHASSACFGLDAVIAEPVADSSSGGGYVLGAGVNYTSPNPIDSIFRSGFEDCTS
jgi:hypothetical protein